MLNDNFDQYLKKVTDQNFSAPDTESFLKGLHQVRIAREESHRGFLNGVAAATLVLTLGLFTVAQLKDNPSDMLVVDQFPTILTDYETELFIYDMADYLIQESDDIWETLAFLDEVNFEPVISLLEE